MKRRVQTFMLAVIILVISMAIPVSAAEKSESTASLLAAAPNLNTAADWAKDSIQSAYDKGFIPGDIQGQYSNVITRQEFCRMAVSFVEYSSKKSIDTILSEHGVSRNPSAFTDTNDPDILAAYALGITNGTSANTFSPQGQFTREQAATMLMRTCEVLGLKADYLPFTRFSDITTASPWAIQGIQFVKVVGIMGGTGTVTPTFSPKGVYTRQESIVSFDRITPHTGQLDSVSHSDIRYKNMAYIYEFFEIPIRDIIAEMGQPIEENYAGIGHYYDFGDITLYVNDATGMVSHVKTDSPASFSIAGIRMNRSRDEMLSFFGTPKYEGEQEPADMYYGYEMVYEFKGFEATFYMSSANGTVQAILCSPQAREVYYPNEVLYKGIPLRMFKNYSISYLIETLGEPLADGYTELGDYGYVYGDYDIEFVYSPDDVTSVKHIVVYNLNSVTLDGASLSDTLHILTRDIRPLSMDWLGDEFFVVEYLLPDYRLIEYYPNPDSPVYAVIFELF